MSQPSTLPHKSFQEPSSPSPPQKRNGLELAASSSSATLASPSYDPPSSPPPPPAPADPPASPRTPPERPHERRPVPPKILRAALVASLGGVLFGYDLGVVSLALPPLSRHFDLSSSEMETVVSSVYVGGVVGAASGGAVCDRLGRRTAIRWTDLAFAGSAVVLMFSPNLGCVILGRIAVGVAVSVSAVADVTYLTEISPTEYRGGIVSLNEACIALGFLLAYLVGWALATMAGNDGIDGGDSGWRIMFGLCGFLAVAQYILMQDMPESPVYLINKGRLDEAKEALYLMHGCSPGDLLTTEESGDDTHANIIQQQKFEAVEQNLMEMIERSASEGQGFLTGTEDCYGHVQEGDNSFSHNLSFTGISNNNKSNNNPLTNINNLSPRFSEKDPINRTNVSSCYSAAPSRKEVGGLDKDMSTIPEKVLNDENMISPLETGGSGRDVQPSLSSPLSPQQSAPPSSISATISSQSPPYHQPYYTTNEVAYQNSYSAAADSTDIPNGGTKRGDSPLMLASLFSTLLSHPRLYRLWDSVAAGFSVTVEEIRLHRHQCIVALFLSATQQFCGHVNVLNFAPEIFAQISDGGVDGTTGTVFLGIVKFIITCIFIWKIDGVGRRRLLLLGIALIATGMVVLFAAFSEEPTYLQSASDALPSQVSAAIAAAGAVVVVIGYAISFGPLTWLITSEMFPARIRGRALGASTIISNGSAALTSHTFLTVQERWGKNVPFGFYAAVGIIGWVVACLIVPECKGRNPEEIQGRMEEMWFWREGGRCCCCFSASGGGDSRICHKRERVLGEERTQGAGGLCENRGEMT